MTTGTSMAGLRDGHIRKNLTKNDETQRYSRRRIFPFTFSVQIHLSSFISPLSQSYLTQTSNNNHRTMPGTHQSSPSLLNLPRSNAGVVSGVGALLVELRNVLVICPSLRLQPRVKLLSALDFILVDSENQQSQISSQHHVTHQLVSIHTTYIKSGTYLESTHNYPKLHDALSYSSD